MTTIFSRFFTLAYTALTPEERKELKGILIKMALAIVGGTGLLTWFVIVPAVSQTTGQSPPTTASQEINVIAREPGTGYNVKAFCDDPTTMIGQTPMTDAPAGGTRYVALRGTESVNWADSPPGANPTATHYWTAQDGTHQQEPVEITRAAADCFKRRAK